VLDEWSWISIQMAGKAIGQQTEREGLRMALESQHWPRCGALRRGQQDGQRGSHVRIRQEVAINSEAPRTDGTHHHKLFCTSAHTKGSLTAGRHRMEPFHHSPCSCPLAAAMASGGVTSQADIGSLLPLSLCRAWKD
jgi:hypothetical protein